MLLEICNTRSGAVLNRHDGMETADALIFRLEGIAAPEATVTVNGVLAERNDQRFSCDVRLTQKINHVAVKASNQFGDCTLEVVLVWDKASFRRYHFFIDDHIFTFADLAQKRPARAFDHFYLKKLKEFHRDYGTKFSLNCFYHNTSNIVSPITSTTSQTTSTNSPPPAVRPRKRAMRPSSIPMASMVTAPGEIDQERCFLFGPSLGPA